MSTLDTDDRDSLLGSSLSSSDRSYTAVLTTEALESLSGEPLGVGVAVVAVVLVLLLFVFVFVLVLLLLLLLRGKDEDRWEDLVWYTLACRVLLVELSSLDLTFLLAL